MQSSYFKRLAAVVLGVALIVGSFFIGAQYGSSQALALQGSSSNNSIRVPSYENEDWNNADFGPFWKVWKILNDEYVPTHSSTTPDTQQKVWGAIEGLTASYGDPYTVFFPPAESKDFQTQISGNFEGIGMEVGIKDGILTVEAPLKNSPAERAGIKSGDRILEINGTSTEDMSTDVAVSLIRGPKGTSVTLTLLSSADKKTHTVKVTRERIDLPTIQTIKRPDGIFVIQLYSFSANAAELFRGALKEFAESGDSKLILDLRGNPGGYLEGAVDMASWFLPEKAVIVKEDSGGHVDANGQSQDVVYYSKGYNVFNKQNNKNFQMMILVDNGSASASEILSGALQQQGVAKLVGTQTFGKGSVQELVNITPDTSLKVTVARWLTPNGTSISQHGLTPDYEVPLTDDDIANKYDAQMAKAVELLGGTYTK